jgi:protein-disulfide reductase (glutathione)
LFAKFIIRLLVAVLIGAGAVHGISAASPSYARNKVMGWNDSQIKWLSFDDGLREAGRTGKPILAVFYAEWCPHCAEYSQLFRDPEVVDRARDLVMVRVNSDEQPDISARYAPDGEYIPRTMVLRPDGALVASIHGGQRSYRYFLDHDSSHELLGVMKRAGELGGARRSDPQPPRMPGAI